jgi:hypothetical protein
MKFEEALTAMREGKKIRRAEWDDDQYVTSEIGFASEEIVHMPERHSACFDGDDVTATDWEIYPTEKYMFGAGTVTPVQRHTDHLNPLVTRDSQVVAESAQRKIHKFLQVLEVLQRHYPEICMNVQQIDRRTGGYETRFSFEFPDRNVAVEICELLNDLGA